MNNQLATINTNDIMAIGKAFYESGMFADIKSAAQAVVKVSAGAEMGIPPFASMSGIHIIQGKPTVGAGLMAAMVKGSGKYDYKVVESTEKNCSVDFYQGKEKLGNSSFSADDAKKAGTKNMDKYPKNMLFARAISNGVKFYCPDVFAGPVYTPEELGEETITEDIPHEELTTKIDPKLQVEEIQSAVKGLELCTTLDDLKNFKAQQPKYVQDAPAFKEAGKARMAVINTTAT